MTELLYLADVAEAYVTTFRGRIVALPPGGVVLDRTRFYPTGGGQPCDLGSLRLPDGTALPVLDVAKSGEAVIHRVGRKGSAPSALVLGTEVDGTIDWPRRHRHMRGHTFQHLLSARVFALTGRRTRKANLTGKGGIIEVEGPWPAGITERELDADVRPYVAADRTVQIRHLPRAEYERETGGRSGLVPLPPHVDPVRVVEIDAADRCPCGGTHLRRTGEIGGFVLLPPTPLVGGDVRVTFTLDERAPPTPSG